MAAFAVIERLARRKLLPLLLPVFALLMLAGPPASSEPAAIDKPNIILLFADDLGYGDLASHGHPYARTPNLDRLAAAGTRFLNFNVTGVSCNPSRTGLLTGRHPDSFPRQTNRYGFQEHVSVMELMKRAGYRTGHFGKWHLGPDHTDGTYGIDEVRVRGRGGRAPRGRDEWIYRDAMAFIERHRDVPFYVNVMGSVTHNPIKPRADLVALAGFDDLRIDRAAFRGQQIQHGFDKIEAVGGDISTSMASYLTEVYFLDQFVGDLLKQLDALGLRDKTLVAFSSDQGPATVHYAPSQPWKLNAVGYSGGLRGQKHDEHEGGVRVPFILRWPGHVPAGKVNRDSNISALDWLPTLARLTGVPIDHNEFHGEDVLDIWLGADRKREAPLFWRRSMKQGDWRIYFEDGRAIELFDLSTDPAETDNLVKARPQVAKRLTALWKDWRAGLP